MPKGGAERTQTAIDSARGRSTALGENLRVGQLEPQLAMIRDQFYHPAATRSMADYGNIMNQYQQFATTGGFSPGDISNIRARALSPSRAVYDRAMQNVARQQSLQGGYSPGANVLRARMSRDLATGLSDQSRAVEADIAQMKQRGQLAGLAGMNSIYGTTPGAAATFGNQMLNASGQLIDATQAEMQLPLQLAQLQAQQGMMPGKWQQGFQNVLGGAQAVAGLVYPWLAGGAGATGGGIPSFGNAPYGAAPPTFRAY